MINPGAHYKQICWEFSISQLEIGADICSQEPLFKKNPALQKLQVFGELY